jgi:hypothetical protein
MSHEWYKSFGFREFDKEMLEETAFEGYEELCLHQFNIQKQLALANCPNCGKLLFLTHYFYFMTCRCGAY